MSDGSKYNYLNEDSFSTEQSPETSIKNRSVLLYSGLALMVASIITALVISILAFTKDDETVVTAVDSYGFGGKLERLQFNLTTSYMVLDTSDTSLHYITNNISNDSSAQLLTTAPTGNNVAWFDFTNYTGVWQFSGRIEILNSAATASQFIFALKMQSDETSSPSIAHHAGCVVLSNTNLTTYTQWYHFSTIVDFSSDMYKTNKYLAISYQNTSILGTGIQTLAQMNVNLLRLE
jgi:hypothetical protein